MESLTNFIENIEQYLGIALLMFSTFLVGYFLAYRFAEGKSEKLIKRLKKEVNTLQSKRSVSDIETIFTEIKPKIVEVVKQQAQENEHKETVSEKEIKPPSIPEKARTTYITYNATSQQEDTEENELDFDSFGYADSDTKDDLTQIHGIGPYIERKLNEIGIYNYDQISRLKPHDIIVITELIDFFPGRIERDNWVAQAESLKVF
ncbi:hypothetical protein ACFQO1_06095 [Jejudonia soesokkakensis]|uniref:Flap endonuclease-1-like 5' DNA nuclease n=1 Tax=Jejudonia soesokkakensis TaxID=1323432 RepID=A0ABW2MSK0_9FLAO